MIELTMMKVNKTRTTITLTMKVKQGPRVRNERPQQELIGCTSVRFNDMYATGAEQALLPHVERRHYISTAAAMLTLQMR